MSFKLTIRREAHFRIRNRSRKALYSGPAPRDSQPDAVRVPRLSRLMALAIRFDQLIRSRTVSDQADLARLGHVTRGRLTQIMNLLLLAPDIQEEILFLKIPIRGEDPFPERRIRDLTMIPDWRKQRACWRELTEKALRPGGQST